jgi:hypothetical protein
MRLLVCSLMLPLLLTVGCANAPTSRTGLLAADLALDPVRERRDSRFERKLDAELVRSSDRVGVPEVTIAVDAYESEISAAQAALVANRAGRSLCLALARHFELVGSAEDATVPAIRLRLMLTDLEPTSVGISGTSALLGVFVPGPFRLPAGLGGLAAEGEATLGERPVLQLRWSKGANTMLDGAQMSTIGDAYQLANDLGKDYANSLIDAVEEPGAGGGRLPAAQVELNRALCRDNFGEASLAGRGASFLLPLAPESIDAGAPIADDEED